MNWFAKLRLSFLLLFAISQTYGQNSQMGKTWVVFVENSGYETFASIEGPQQDVTVMKDALSNYNIDKVIHKKDLTKKQMEMFFNSELKKQILTNNVNSLLIWYAGHGKSIKQTGFWVPVDAARDDESTYFNMQYLKESIKAYSDKITHLLIITDACESGPSFYQAMRNIVKEKTCSDSMARTAKSSQVLSSSGYELAMDQSSFTRTFARTLTNNSNSCIPIDKIVVDVTLEVVKNNQPKPKFGKIEGLEDADGTFFFISK